MNNIQKEIKLKPQKKGFHLITNEILQAVPEIIDIKIGILNIFIKHTSASLLINEKADPTVRIDFNNYFERAVPEEQDYFQHIHEGKDDMPAHIKAAILGSSLQIPITNGKINLGRWQGIYLCEHRNKIKQRKIIITIC